MVNKTGVVADLQLLSDAAAKAFGHVDIMVNNAGVETRTSVLDTTESQYEKQYHVGPRGLADAEQHCVLRLQRWDAHAHAHRGSGAGLTQYPRRRGSDQTQWSRRCRAKGGSPT